MAACILRAKVSNEIMDSINRDLSQDQKPKEPYWISRKSKGIIPKLLSEYGAERFRQQELCNEPMHLALKLCS
jgi:hypothetical protein